MNIKITPLLDTLCLEKISDETYFSNKYSNYISNSRLSLINPSQDGSPEKFFEGFKPKYSAAFDLGNMIKDFIAVPIEESSELLQTKIGEGCDLLIPR